MDRGGAGARSVGPSSRPAGDCLGDWRWGAGRRGRRRSMGPALSPGTAHRERRRLRRPPPQSGMDRGGAGARSVGPSSRPAGDCLGDWRCGAGRRGRRRSIGPALHRAGALTGHRPPGAPASTPATAAGGHGPWGCRRTVGRQVVAVGRSLLGGVEVRRRPARTPALHGATAPCVRGLHGCGLHAASDLRIRSRKRRRTGFAGEKKRWRRRRARQTGRRRAGWRR